MSRIPEDVEIQRQLTSLHIDYWFHYGVLQWRWWLLIFLYMAFFLIWLKLAGRSRLHDTCLYALLMLIIAMGINEYGQELTLWDYPVDIIPIFPPLTAINLLVLPLAYSIVYRHFSDRKSFIIWVLIVSAVICFILEPVLSVTGLYMILKWEYYYNFLLYVPTAIFIRYVVNKIRKEEKNYQ